MKRDLVDRLRDLEYSADDVYMASAVQEAVNEIDLLRARIEAAEKATWKYQRPDTVVGAFALQIKRILRGEQP